MTGIYALAVRVLVARFARPLRLISPRSQAVAAPLLEPYPPLEVIGSDSDLVAQAT
jgi:hypothetical protein